MTLAITGPPEATTLVVSDPPLRHPAIKITITMDLTTTKTVVADHLHPIIDHQIIIMQDQPMLTDLDRLATTINIVITIDTNTPTKISSQSYLLASNTHYFSSILYFGLLEPV